MKYLFFLLLGISQLSYSQQSIDGSWKRENGISVTFISLGKLNPGYLLIEETNVYWVKKKGNSIGFKSKDKKNIVFSNFEVKGDLLSYTDPFKGKISAKRHSYNLQNPNMKSISIDSNAFFDYSTDKYYAGDFYDLTPKGPFPFYINRMFIVKNRVDSISFLLTKKIIKNSVVISEDTAGRCLLYFTNGFTSKLLIINNNPKTHRDTISWNYHYSKQNILDSITVPGGILKFDKDGYVIDEFGFKVLDRNEQPTFWEYKNGLPFKALKTFGGNFERKNRYFTFNEYNQLIEIKEKQEGNNKSYYIGYFLEYDEKGIPKKVSNVRFW
jgi:hypothetical protein